MELVKLKKALVEEWRLLQSDNDVGTKKSAYKNIVNLSNELREQDKGFSLDERALEKYKEFRPDDLPELNKKVKWAKYDTDRPLGSKGELENEYNYFVQTAVRIVSKRIPDTDTDTDKFGTIVNATIANLIAMSKH